MYPLPLSLLSRLKLLITWELKHFSIAQQNPSLGENFQQNHATLQMSFWVPTKYPSELSKSSMTSDITNSPIVCHGNLPSSALIKLACAFEWTRHDEWSFLAEVLECNQKLNKGHHQNTAASALHHKQELYWYVMLASGCAVDYYPWTWTQMLPVSQWQDCDRGTLLPIGVYALTQMVTHDMKLHPMVSFL